MKEKHKKRRFKQKLNKKGFSLVEVLIAVGILILITVPLAMNMLSSSQMNGTAKQVSASSDLTTAMMEVMQSVDLSDILTDINGYESDEYGTKLDYLLTKSMLKNYNPDNIKSYEVHDLGNGTYKIAIKQGEGDAALDPTKITSSIRTRITGAAQRNYFVGQKTDWDGDGKLNEYAFLIQNVENDEINVDILATVVPEQSFSIVNITSMSQSEVIYVRQDKDLDSVVASEFFKAHEMHKALKSGVMTIESKTQDWFLNNMSRTITIDIKKDIFSEATTIMVSAVYTVDTTSLPEGDQTIKKTLGSFTTNSTSEFARGIYLYYYPLMNNSQTGDVRDNIVINNKNELSTPVYLIAMSNDASEDFSAVANYNPTLTVNELSSEIYTERARTTVCSNIDNGYWTKTLNPQDNRTLSVKSLGNLSDQQTLYTLTVKVYRHQNNSIVNGQFTPRDKDLLVETKGTFIDTSELLDITSDSNAGDATAPQKATVATHKLVYNGSVQKGVYGVGIDIKGISEAINAGTYEAKVTPKPGYYWADGSDGTRNITWSIARDPSAVYTPLSPVYNGEMQAGIDGQWLVTDGITQARDHGYYTAYVQPDQNHAWTDGTYGKKSVSWTLQQRPVEITWHSGPNLDTWTYDGVEHKGTYDLGNIITGDIVTAIEKNNSIKDVGSKEAMIVGFSDKNYCVPAEGSTHTISITTIAGAVVELKEEVIYDGTTQSAVQTANGVIFSGKSSESQAGYYTFTATLLPGYVWADDGTTGTRTYSWELKRRVVEIQWGVSEWVYDGTVHFATCTVVNKVDGDHVEVQLADESIQDVGSKMAKVVGTDNGNYIVPTPYLEHEIKVTPAPYARYRKYDFNYDGNSHVGVTGSFIVYLDEYYSQINVLYDESDPNRPVIAYKAKIQPQPNYCWEGTDGDTSVKEIEWTIYPKALAYYYTYPITYTGIFDDNGNEVGDIGIWGKYYEIIGGHDKQTKAGEYTTIIRPLANYVWEETGDARPISVNWSIEAYVPPVPYFSKDSFEYNGESQRPEIYIGSLDLFYEFTDDGWYPGQEQGAAVPLDTAGRPMVTTNQAVHTGVYYVWVRQAKAETDAPDPDNPVPPHYVNVEPVCLTWEIYPRTVTIQFDANEWTYDATTHTGTAKATNICGSDTYQFTYANNTAMDYTPGHEFQITGIKNPYNDYILPANPELLKGIMKINKRTLEINWGTLIFYYYEPSKYYSVDPNPKTPSLCSADSGNVDFIVTNETRNPAGSQTVTITGLTGSRSHNYQLPGASLLSTTMTVKPAPLAQVTVYTGMIYNKSSRNGVKSTTHCSYVRGDLTGTNAGTYTVVYKPDPNYAWDDYDESERSFTWKIGKAANPGFETEPRILAPTYDGTAQYMCTAGSAKVGSVEYRIYVGGASATPTAWSTSRPTAITATQPYFVEWRCKATTNYYASEEGGGTTVILHSQTAYLHNVSAITWSDSFASSKFISMFSAQNCTIVSGDLGQTAGTVASAKQQVWTIRASPAQNYCWKDNINASGSASAPDAVGNTGVRSAAYQFYRANTAYFQMGTPTVTSTTSTGKTYKANWTQVGTLPQGTLTHFHKTSGIECGCGDFKITAILDGLHNWKDNAAVASKEYYWSVP